MQNDLCRLISLLLSILSHAVNLSSVKSNEETLGKLLRASSSSSSSSSGASRRVHVQQERERNAHRLRNALMESYSCRPVSSLQQLAAQNWRGRSLEAVLRDTGLQERIAIIPFWNLTAARHDLHSRYAKDCTHFCNSPLLWAPTWNYIFDRYLLLRHSTEGLPTP